MSFLGNLLILSQFDEYLSNMMLLAYMFRFVSWMSNMLSAHLHLAPSQDDSFLLFGFLDLMGSWQTTGVHVKAPHLWANSLINQMIAV